MELQGQHPYLEAVSRHTCIAPHALVGGPAGLQLSASDVTSPAPGELVDALSPPLSAVAVWLALSLGAPLPAPLWLCQLLRAASASPGLPAPSAANTPLCPLLPAASASPGLPAPSLPSLESREEVRLKVMLPKSLPQSDSGWAAREECCRPCISAVCSAMCACICCSLQAESSPWPSSAGTSRQMSRCFGSESAACSRYSQVSSLDNWVCICCLF